jgi:hypothetical protein
MATVKYFIVTIISLTLTLSSTAQTIEKTFSGWWADTWWTFDFYKDTTYIRVSSGHYGFTEVKGNYKISKDTLQLISGFKNTHGTVNEFYLLDKDSFLIDLTLLYDYRLTNDKNTLTYTSRKRYDVLKKPNQDSIAYISKSDFDSLVLYSIGRLKTKDIWQISDTDHIQIIKIKNTISMSDDNNHNRRFVNGIYTDFESLIKEKNYGNEMSKIYDWIPNRGMGFYFEKLQVELGGTPHFFSRFVVK